jgi:hypothetical protein
LPSLYGSAGAVLRDHVVRVPRDRLTTAQLHERGIAAAQVKFRAETPAPRSVQPRIDQFVVHIHELCRHLA